MGSEYSFGDDSHGISNPIMCRCVVTTANPEGSTPEDVVDRIMADPAMSPRVVALFNSAQEKFKTGHLQDCSCGGCMCIRFWLIRNFPRVRYFGCTLEAVWRNVMISMRFDYVI